MKESSNIVNRIGELLNEEAALMEKSELLMREINHQWARLIRSIDQHDLDPDELFELAEKIINHPNKKRRMEFAEEMGLSLPNLRRFADYDNVFDAFPHKIKLAGSDVVVYQGAFPIGYQKLPRQNKACVYFLLGRETEILYIGQSMNVKSRLKQHYDSKTFDAPIEFWIVQRVDQEEMMEIEREYIRFYCPPFNVKDNPDPTRDVSYVA